MPNAPGYDVTVSTSHGHEVIRVHTHDGPEMAATRAKVTADRRWGAGRDVWPSVVSVEHRPDPPPIPVTRMPQLPALHGAASRPAPARHSWDPGFLWAIFGLIGSVVIAYVLNALVPAVAEGLNEFWRQLTGG